MGVKSLGELRAVFQRQVIPLLQEYFFDDWRRVELVLSSGNGQSAFLRREVLRGSDLFGSRTDLGETERVRYAVTESRDWDAAAFTSIYSSQAETVQPEA